jgi:hypothetical protein
MQTEATTHLSEKLSYEENLELSFGVLVWVKLVMERAILLQSSFR